MSFSILLVAACIPSIVLLCYIYRKDRAEKEPFSLLALLFGLGAASALPVVIAELALGKLNVFPEGSVPSNFHEAYIVAGLCEEVGKFLVLYFVTRKNKNFNCLFDGVIYAVVVSLGFDTLENILYVFENGLQIALTRAITSVPGHMFFGVLMGYFYTFWHLFSNLEVVEQKYAQMRLIDTVQPNKVNKTTYFVLALVVPILVHGTYDFLIFSATSVTIVAFFILLIGLYIYCFKKIKTMSAQDQHEANMIAAILNQKYPYLYPRIRQAMQAQQMQYNPYTQAAYNPYSAQNNYGYQYQQPTQRPVQNGYYQPQQAPNNNNYTYR